MPNTNIKDELLDLYVTISQVDKVTPENTQAYYNYLQLRLDYLKGLVKEQQGDNNNDNS